MKTNKKLIALLAVILIFCVSLVFVKFTRSFAIYRDVLNTKVYLSVLDPSSTIEVNFNTHGGDAVDPIDVAINTEIGALPVTEKAGYNFVGWYTQETGGEKLTPDTIITGAVTTYHAHWVKIVCKKATTLHTEICKSDGSCRSYGYTGDNTTITYGILPTNTSPIAGDAYDCDVNDDGVYDPATERFYYIRKNGTEVENAVLIHYTSFDAQGQMDSSKSRGSKDYETALTYLPDTTLWDNPQLVSYDGKAARFASYDDIETACGTITLENSNYFRNCVYFLETSRFQSDSLGRAGIWIEKQSTNYYRIHTKNRFIASVANTSENTARPTIEIPYTSIDGFKEQVSYNVRWDVRGGDPINKYVRYEGEQIGQLPTPTYEGHNFLGWYTDTNWTTLVTPTTIINDNVTFYAKWEEIVDDLEYVFHIPGSCEFNGTDNDKYITSSTNDCISTINPTGSNIDYTATNNKYINTGVDLYNTTNHKKDYEIGFTITSYDSNSNTRQATLMNTKLEGNNYPGLVFRKFDDTTKFDLSSRNTSAVNERALIPSTDVQNVKIYRIYNSETEVQEIFYSINNEEKVKINDLSSFNPTFNLSVWFGAAPTNVSANAGQRFFKGTLSNMYIKLESDDVVKYKVTFDAGLGTSDFDEKTVKKGTAIGTLPTATLSGYYFDGWYTEPNGGGSKLDTSTIITAPITYYAYYKDLYLVTFDGQGGTVSIDPNIIEVADGYSIGTLPTADFANKYFDGWYTLPNGAGTKIDGTETISQDVTYYANYKDLHYVTFDGQGGTVTVAPNPMPVIDGEIIGAANLPSAYLQGMAFKGWYTLPNGAGTKIDGTETISQDVTYYAYYISSCTVTFDGNGGTPDFHSKDVAVNSAIGELPTADNSDITLELDGWYSDLDDPTTKADENTIITDDITYHAKWVTTTKIAMIGTTRYDTLAAAVAAVPTTGVKTTIIMLNNTKENVKIEDGRYVYLDLNGKTVSNTNVSTQVFTVQSSVAQQPSTLELVNGTATSSQGSGMINVNGNGILKVGDQVELKATGTRQAIYNDGGTVYILDGATISATTDSRSAVHNRNSGNIYITGGTITSTKLYAIYNENGNIEIGTQDGDVDITKPVIQGKTYGIAAYSNYKFYDGIIKGETAAVGKTSGTGNTPSVSKDEGETKISSYETGTNKITGEDGNYKTLYLQYQSNKYKITLNPDGGQVSKTVIMVEPGNPVGAIPIPTKGAYTFVGWYDESNQLVDENNTYPTRDEVYTAVWSFTPAHDTFNIINDPMRVYYNSISTWKNTEATFLTSMENNFNNYSCLACDSDPSKPYQSCPATGEVQCDRPKGYATGVTGTLDVYEATENNQVYTKGAPATYVTVTSDGTIYDMIPGKTYYWELSTDPAIYGTVTVSGERRILEAEGVRNIRDLGGLQVDTDGDGTVDGTIEYGRMFRGPKLNSASDVSALQRLGITEEIDLRGSQNDPKLSSNYVPRQITNYEIDPTNYGTNYTVFKQALTATMEDVISGENIYFHCAIGTDRTGTMAYFLEGLLGVSEEDRLQDYELSYFYGLLNRHRFYRNQPGSSITHRFEYMHNLYDTNQKIYDYYVSDPDPDVQAANEARVARFRNAVITPNN